jgi:hypothetical protein
MPATGPFLWWPQSLGEVAKQLEAHQLQLLLRNGKPASSYSRFTSAAAALKAMMPGGQDGIPTRAVVEGFLQG